MGDRPLVSVIIPVYNRSELLFKAVNSVLKQTYQNFEIIVVDDNSSENIGEALSRIADKRVNCIKNSRARGPAGARNAGMMAAKGEYIAFLDSDDEFLPGHLEDSVFVLENEPGTGIVFGKARYYTEDGRETDYMWPNLIKKVGRIANASDKGKYLVFNDFIFKFMLREGCFFNLPSVVMKREIADKEFLMREDIFHIHDLEYWQRVSRYYKFAYLKNDQIKYSIHGENISIPYTKEHAADILSEELKSYHIMSNYNFLEPDDKIIINKNIARVHFEQGYKKRKARNYKEAQKSYIKSLYFNFSLLTVKAYLAAILLRAWSALFRRGS